MKNIFILTTIALFALTFCACKKNKNSTDNWQTYLIKNIEHQINTSKLCLLITDNMCSECIIKEYINLKTDSLDIVILGLFDNKKNFISSTNKNFINNRIFIDRKQAGNIFFHHNRYILFMTAK
ncbi:MAG: hypothetical protein LBG92_11240 [Prevotellaceae bacterium]|jgi:hypothetical protein|nr:hypothetical protein [Prevotellaceae bacterium]